MKKLLFIVLFAFSFCIKAQKDTLPYNRKAEIVYQGKRYRVYNNYLTFGAAKVYSSVRSSDQDGLNVDFQFHLTKQYFQAGFFMTGDQLYKNANNLEAHICYGIRRENEKYNFAAYAGPSYSHFVTGYKDTSNVIHVFNHTVLGGYVCLQAVYKIKYDVGIGAELFADISADQKLIGARVILFFSGAYHGEKKSGRFRSKDK